MDHAAVVLGELRRHWGWILAWGVVLLLAGLAGLGYEVVATVVTVEMIGGLLVALGLVEIVQAVKHLRWSGFFLFLVGGVLSVVAGLVLWRAPLAGMAALTLLMAGYFLVLGAFRAIGAISTRHPGWAWGALGGAVTVALGAMIASEWPASSLWVIGLYVSVSLLLQGLGYVMLAMAARRAPPSAGTAGVP
jgi:uncharacterized membrane protein HdeD (DUF308 family)